MGGHVSVVFLDVNMCNMKEGVVVPGKPSFYKRYFDDTYICGKLNFNDEFQNLNSYHNNMKLTLEENPGEFLNIEIIRKNNTKVVYKVNEVSCSLKFQNLNYL